MIPNSNVVVAKLEECPHSFRPVRQAQDGTSLTRRGWNALNNSEASVLWARRRIRGVKLNDSEAHLASPMMSPLVETLR